MTGELASAMLLDATVIDDPFAFYRRLREQDRVWNVPWTRLFCVSRARDAELATPGFLSTTRRRGLWISLATSNASRAVWPRPLNAQPSRVTHFGGRRLMPFEHAHPPIENTQVWTSVIAECVASNCRW